MQRSWFPKNLNIIQVFVYFFQFLCEINCLFTFFSFYVKSTVCLLFCSSTRRIWIPGAKIGHGRVGSSKTKIEGTFGNVESRFWRYKNSYFLHTLKILMRKVLLRFSFHEWNKWKNPQFNFLSQNLSRENVNVSNEMEK